MRLDINDIQFTTTTRDKTNQVSARHIPTGVSVNVERCYDEGDRWEMVEHLREAIRNHTPAGKPDKLVRINKDGAVRILNGVPGSVFVVHAETESPRGQIMHVTDTAGNIWSLGPDQYELFEQPK